MRDETENVMFESVCVEKGLSRALGESWRGFSPPPQIAKMKENESKICERLTRLFDFNLSLFTFHWDVLSSQKEKTETRKAIKFQIRNSSTGEATVWPTFISTQCAKHTKITHKRSLERKLTENSSSPETFLCCQSIGH